MDSFQVQYSVLPGAGHLSTCALPVPPLADDLESLVNRGCNAVAQRQYGKRYRDKMSKNPEFRIKHALRQKIYVKNLDVKKAIAQRQRQKIYQAKAEVKQRRRERERKLEFRGKKYARWRELRAEKKAEEARKALSTRHNGGFQIDHGQLSIQS